MSVTKRIFILASIIFLIGICYVAARQFTSKKSEANKSQSAQTVGADGRNEVQETLDGATITKVGETNTYATQDVRVNSAHVTDTLTSPTGEVLSTAEDGTKYLIINMTVKNTTDAPIRYRSFNLMMSDGSYMSDDDSVALYLSNGLFEADLNPKVPETGDDVFTIPSSAHEGVLGGTIGNTSHFLGTKLTF